MKKFIICLIILAICISFVPPKRSYAMVSAVPAVAVPLGTMGGRVLIGMGEKIGIKYTTKNAREKAIERWNLELYNKIKYYDEVGKEYERLELERLQQLLKTAPDNVVPIESKPGFGRILVDTTLFLTGLDLFVDGYNALKDGYDNKKMTERMKEHADAISDGSRTTNVGGITFFPAVVNGVEQFWFGAQNDPRNDWAKGIVASMEPFASDDPNKLGIEWYGWITGVQHDITYYGDVYDKFLVHYEWFVDGNKRMIDKPVYVKNGLMSSTSGIVAETVSGSDLPSSVAYPPLMVPFIDNGTVPEGLPETIAIEIPMSDTYPEADTWNDPMDDKIIEPGTDPLPETPPADGGTGDGTPTRKPEDDSDRFSKLVTTQFPFSLPWDLAMIIGMINAEPKQPVFEMDKELTIGSVKMPFKFKHEVNWLDSWIGYFRAFIVIGYVMFLIMATRRLLGGAQ